MDKNLYYREINKDEYELITLNLQKTGNLGDFRKDNDKVLLIIKYLDKILQEHEELWKRKLIVKSNISEHVMYIRFVKSLINKENFYQNEMSILIDDNDFFYIRIYANTIFNDDKWTNKYYVCDGVYSIKILLEDLYSKISKRR